MLSIIPIKAFEGTYDNYIWLVIRGHLCCAVDPGDARPVLDYINTHGLTLDSILITHYHGDHIGGVKRLRTEFPECTVYAPEHPKITHATHIIQAGDIVSALGVDYKILDVSGHTLDHIAYFSTSSELTEKLWLFCGDALFSAGCGRLFEGTPEQMHHALMLMASLPDETLVYCTHEYTLSNLTFATHVDENNTKIKEHQKHVEALINKGLPSLPSTIGLEKQINPFLRCDNPSIIHRVNKKFDSEATVPHQIFASLRQWKDNF